MLRFVLLLLCLWAPISQASGFFDSLTSSKQPTFLPVEQAFGLTVKMIDAQTLQADLRITPTYYLYRDKITFTSDNPAIKIVSVSLPKGDIKDDPNFGKLAVLHDSALVEIKLQRSNTSAETLVLNASYQGCSEKGLCYPPVTPVFNINLPEVPAVTAKPDPVITTALASSPVATSAPPVAQSPASQSEEGKVTQLLKHSSFWAVLSLFFGMGLLLAFTPCIFPMIPILSGIIVGRGHKITKTHAFVLSLTYVLGMALMYTIAGVIAGMTGGLLSSALQNPWALGGFATVFVLLSLSMFGFYDLQLPSSWQSKLTDTSNQLHGGHLTGVFGMGALSAVIIGPCVAAPLTGALLYIGQTNDVVLGGAALFAMALGMGAPLLIIGTSAGAILPKAGAWMESVKKFFGVILLGLAVWIIHPLLPVSVHMLLWAILLVFSAIYLRALEPLPHNAHGWGKFFKALGVLSLLLGVAYLIGALSGAPDMLRPLGGLAKGEAVASGKLPFTRVKNNAELDQALAAAKGKVVMVDFYADWCVACKELEAYTFTDANVQAKLKNAVLLKVDVTANNDDDKALLKRFNVYGPPVLLFFDAQGQELTGARVTGFENADKFLQSLGNAGL